MKRFYILQLIIFHFQIFWSLDPNSRFTIGLFDEYWITPNPRILDLLDRLQPNPTKFEEARNG